MLLAVWLFFVSSQAEAQRMDFVSAEVQPIARYTAAGSHHLWLQRFHIITKGKSHPLLLTKMLLGKEKKKGKSVTEVSVYSTGKDSVFTTAKVFGSLKQKGSLVTGEQELSEGSNYFWIAHPNKPGDELISFDLSTQDYQPLWADEFTADTVNANNWSFENGFVRNEEHQWYQKENATCKNGFLIIEAKREKKPNPHYVAGSADWRKGREFIEYTAASMLTARKQSWQYGRFEMRARIDTAAGYWPAWWTLGVAGRWPSNGEIDIMEYYRGKILANYAVGTAKPYTAHWFSNTYPVAAFHPAWKDSFHIWRMDWDEQGIGIYLDDVLLNYQRQTDLANRDGSGTFPFRQPHYMLLNLAIGGMNGGNPDRTAFPLIYEVDYVRVSQKIAGRYTAVGTYKPTKETKKNK